MGKSIYTVKRTFRCTPSEDKKIQDAANKDGYKNTSAYLRSLINNKPVSDLKLKNKLDHMNYELGKVGTNINQIAKNNNSFLYSADDRKHLMLMVEKINNDLRDIKTYCYTSQSKE